MKITRYDIDDTSPEHYWRIRFAFSENCQSMEEADRFVCSELRRIADAIESNDLHTWQAISENHEDAPRFPDSAAHP